MIFSHDLFRISIRQVFRQRRRSLGVLFAVALGTASLVSLLTLGDEVKKSLNRDLDLLGGATLIKVRFTNDQYPGAPSQFFFEQSVADIAALPGVELTSLSTGKIEYVSLFWRMQQLSIPLLGVDSNYWRACSLVPLQGRLFDTSDAEQAQRVCVIGEELASNLFGSEPAVGQYLPVRGEIFQIIGVVGGLQIADRKKFAFLPLSTMLRRSNGDLFADRLLVRCRTWDDVSRVGAAIPALVARQQDPQYLLVEVSWSQLERVVSMIWWVQLFVAMSIAATLTLGGFGIWNGMMSSVISRTREIGLKKAMGAEESDILLQFLCEAISLSLVSACIGVVLGFAIVETASLYLDNSPPLSLFFAYSGLSLAFSALLGIGAGFYPALQAARMDAVSAIRYE
ncbi:ABC transporter permease [Humidesulfovibrio sp.]|uniref:ABC transporter permease n=1 Tax=Humidesulfovibrio sp. TaxID=2910988 RepID=UPI002D80BCFE|nr:ABC transporter permease [Humidesulfovibrio sp.]